MLEVEVRGGKKWTKRRAVEKGNLAWPNKRRRNDLLSDDQASLEPYMSSTVIKYFAGLCVLTPPSRSHMAIALAKGLGNAETAV